MSRNVDLLCRNTVAIPSASVSPRSRKEKPKQLGKDGGFPQALKDFDSLPGNASTRGLVRVKELPDGTKVVVRHFSTEGRPTLEIQRTDGTVKKIRYN